MLDIPKPKETTQLKTVVKQELADELERFVGFVQVDKPYASREQVIEYMLEDYLGRSTKVMKAFRAWKDKGPTVLGSAAAAE